MNRRMLRFIILALMINLVVQIIMPLRCVRAITVSSVNYSNTSNIDTIEVQKLLQDTGEIGISWSDLGLELGNLRDILSLPKKESGFYIDLTNKKIEVLENNKANLNDFSKKLNNVKANNGRPINSNQQAQMISYVLGVAQNKYSDIIGKEQFSKNITYLYISHYIDNPYYTPGYTDFDNIMADCLTDDDINAYNNFIRVGRFSSVASDITNLSNIIYGNVGYIKEVKSFMDNLKNITANTIYSAHQLDNFDSDRFKSELNDVAIAFKNNYSSTKTQE